MADRKGRLDESSVLFFVYDHNMLKKEEDDLKDAILYFYPEDVSADDQCALCGQVMGMSEFLSATLSKAPPHTYSFEQLKLALKRVGSYSLVLQGQSSTADSLLRGQLDRLYSTFVTFCGSIDSLRLRYKESHGSFVQELGSVWRSLLAWGAAVRHNSLIHTLAALPYVHLPKNDGHLFQQGSHLLQTCQKRPYVIAGAILYKNCVLCSQLSPDLTQQLTCLQNKMPHVSRTTEFELPVGCKIITLFLTDKQLQELCPLDQQAKRHCKTADFRVRRDTGETTVSQAAAGRRMKSRSRRATCPDIGCVQSAAKAGMSVSEKALGSFMRQEERRSGQLQPGVMGVEQMSWKRPPRQAVSLSQVPIVECQQGESPDVPHTAGAAYTYTHVRAEHRATEEDSETDKSLEETQSHIPVKPAAHSQKTEHENKTYTALSTMSGEGETVEKRQEEVLDPSISDLEDQSENEEQIIDTHNELKDHQSLNGLSNDLEFHGSVSKEHHHNEIQPEGSGEEEIVGYKSQESSESTVTVSQAAYHTVLSHVADVHVGAGDRQQNTAASSQPRNQLGEPADGGDNTKRDCSQHMNMDNNSVGIDTCNESNDNEQDLSASHGVDNSEKASVHCCVESLKRSDSHTEHLARSEHCVKHSKCESSGSSRGMDSNGEISVLEMESTLSLIFKNTQDKPDLLDAVFTGIIDQNIEESSNDAAEKSEIEIENPCISCLELLSTKDTDGVDNSNSRCSQCLAKLSKHSKISNHEVIDFGEKPENNENKHQSELSDYDSRVQESENSRELLENGISSSLSSGASTDSTMSRYWTQEMDGLNDVTVYVQCHSDISLLLVMENPDKYQENLFHALWKGSLSVLADLDYNIKESCDVEDTGDNALPGHTYIHLDTLTHRLTGGGSESQEEGSTGGRHAPMITTLHAEFMQHHCLSDINIRSQLSYCYGHHSEVEEAYLQPHTQLKLASGLPTHRDPAFNLENTLRSRLTRDKKI